MNANSIRIQILIPLALTLLLLLVIFIFSLYQIKVREIEDVLDQRYRSVVMLSERMVSERADFMEITLSLLSRDPQLQVAMAAERRTELLGLSAPLFKRFLRPRGISHLYFHRPNGRVFLRVHQPDRFGDSIDRVTLQQAAATGEMSQGPELGPLGTLTHRVALPWYAGGELIGYLEAGEDIDWFMARLRRSVDIEYAVVLRKKYLERAGWEEGMAMLGLPADWDLLPEHVLTDRSIEELPRVFLQSLLAPASDDGPFSLTEGEKAYRGRAMPLIEVSGRQVGEVLILTDVTDKIAAFNASMIRNAILTLVLGGFLFTFSFVLLGRVARQLAAAQQRLTLEYARARENNVRLEDEMAARQKAQEELREVNAQLEGRVAERTAEMEEAHDDLRRLIDHAHSLILTTDAQGRIQKWNRTAEEVTGVRREIALGRDLVTTVIPQRYRDRGRDMLRRVLAGDTVTNFEFVLRDAQGHRVVLLLNATGRRDANGNLNGSIIVCQDITSRKEAESVLRSALREARQARDRIRAILRSLSDGLIVLDENGQVLLLNEATGDLFGIDYDQASGRSYQALFGEGPLSAHLREALVPFSAESAFDFEMTDRDGGRRIIHARTSPIREQFEERDGVLVLMQDVTQQRMIDRMKTEFISTVAHEFRTPLATILGFSELLLSRDDFAPEQRQEFLNYIYQKSESLSEIVDDLLDLSRIEAGRGLDLELDVVSPEEALLPAVQDFRLRFTDYDFQVDLSPCRSGMKVDRRKIVQVMENLLSNAVKYSADSRIIAVSGRCEGNEYQVSVRDWGIGMTREQSAQAFDKFYRADNSNIAVAGTGLGLSIVKHIVASHGGRIWIDSATGTGTSVCFTLPR